MDQIPISRIKAWALRIWGPANSPENPLTGTRFDPVFLEHKDEERARTRRLRAARKRSNPK
jgi:hypothetical protein